MVPITTMVLAVGAIFSRVPREASKESRLRERGGRFVRDMKRRRRTTLLKLESVFPVLGVSEWVCDSFFRWYVGVDGWREGISERDQDVRARKRYSFTSSLR